MSRIIRVHLPGLFFTTAHHQTELNISKMAPLDSSAFLPSTIYPDLQRFFNEHFFDTDSDDVEFEGFTKDIDISLPTGHWANQV